MKRYILPLCLAAVCSLPVMAQDIILLNQDGEKVGVAKDVDKKKVIKGDDGKEIKVEVKAAPGKETATIENGVITVVGPDGEVQTFKMSDARSVTITRSSNTVVGEDGNRKVETRGKAILIGPDGVRREIDLGDGGVSGSSVTQSKLPKTWMIGISCKPASPVLRSQLQLDEDMGLVISRVLDGGAAEKAGLKTNDILVYADQKPIGNRKQLSKVVNEAGKAGNDVSFTVLRAGEEISVAVTPTEREGMNQMMIELGRPGGFGLSLPGLGDGAEFEFRQFGPGIILDDFGGKFGAGDLHKELMGDMEERMQRIQEEMEAMRGLIDQDK